MDKHASDGYYNWNHCAAYCKTTFMFNMYLGIKINLLRFKKAKRD